MSNHNGYSVGLDIGTGSVGWAAIDDDYRLKRAKGNHLLGVRLFDSAETAEERRLFRSTRRRLSRRRWRLKLLRDMFAPELAKVDENFLERSKYSWVHPTDEHNPQVNEAAGVANGALFGSTAADSAFYHDYPTIYHLRQALMQDSKQHDLREIYLAIHHAVKYRGHFLREGEISAADSFDVANLVQLLTTFVEQMMPEFSVTFDAIKLSAILTNDKLGNSGRVEQALVDMEVTGDIKLAKRCFKTIFSGLVGNQIDWTTVFNLQGLTADDKKPYKFKFSDGDIDDKLATVDGLLAPEQYEFVLALQKVFNGLTLKMLLGDAKTISAAMVQRYDDHHQQREALKELRKQDRDAFDQNYRLWLAADSDDKLKAPKAFFTQLILDSDLPQKADYLQKIEDGQFLPRQRTKENGSIPHQLHLNEVRQIIDHQKQYYPFLAETYTQADRTDTKIAGLINFRVPYYVGPLVSKLQSDTQFAGEEKNHWLIKKKDATITPWNLSDVVDTDATENAFIDRLIGTDTYLIGEPTLPANSVTYQTFTVLQELNNIRLEVAEENREQRSHRLDVQLKQAIFNQLFRRQKNVTVKNVETFITENTGQSVKVVGLSQKTKFSNSLSAYLDLKQVLGDQITELSNDQLDEIIKLQTVFEDKVALKRQLSLLSYLSAEHVTALAKKHYTGWGRLSKKLLTSHIVNHVDRINNRTFDDDQGAKTLLDVFYQTDLNFMEVVGNVDDRFGVAAWIKAQNEAPEAAHNVYDEIQELPGDKKTKRGIAQSFRILDDLVRATGQQPDKIYLEFARETQASQQTRPRARQLSELYSGDKVLKTWFDEISAEYKDNNALQRNRLYLYFLQQGKDMYRPDHVLDIDHLEDYDIDHIVPQAFTKRNSLDNMVLVDRTTNRTKSDAGTVPTEIRRAMRPFWSRLLATGFISQQKFDALTRAQIGEMQRERFIARSLVETRQIIKNVAALIGTHFKETQVVALPASLTGDMRRYVDLRKNRDLNDYHHAHDALMIATVGKYIDRKGFFDQGRLSDQMGNYYNKYTKERIKAAREHVQEQSKFKFELTDQEATAQREEERINPFSFVVGSMAAATRGHKLVASTNVETGEIVWNEDDFKYLVDGPLKYKKMLVTLKTTDDSGAFYDQMIIKAGGSGTKQPQFPTKKNRDVALYGGYNNINIAYSAIIKFKKAYRVISIPMFLTSDWEVQNDAAKQWLQKKYPEALLLEKHVPYEQLLLRNVSDDETYPSYAKIRIASDAEIHNAEQLALTIKENNQLALIDNENKVSEEQLLSLFDSISRAMNKRFLLPKHQVIAIALVENKDDFINMPREVRVKTLRSLISLLHADRSRLSSQLSQIGGKLNGKKYGISTLKTDGRLQWSGKLNPTDMLVFQSPTGLFEKRITIEQLAKQAGIK
ncbi:type II CRISPR RNA-guided endonuclease Cas9 [Furfurilactobacillus curtus]|uniref:CRISPR-associated endonuclease Cas9 n=1 Tax=Furfurilactobacillus curtus TaxID=1746200 RepID=A0ABQ5JS34_9LACO